MLFAGVTFGVDEGNKIGVIAKNGTGKSTLLSIIAGTEAPDSGKITWRSGVRVGYLPQQPAFAGNPTVAEAALNGESGKMVGFRCDREGGYVCHYELFDLEKVANFEKKVPLEWITSDNAYVTEDFIDYCLPLIAGETGMKKVDGLPDFVKLKRVFAE